MRTRSSALAEARGGGVSGDATAADRGDVVGRAQQTGVLGERARQVGVVLRGARTEDRPGKLAVALVAALFEARGLDAAAGVWMA